MPRPPRFSLPLALALLLVGCASVPSPEDRAGAPAGFASRAEVDAYVGRFFAAGQADELTIGRDRYLVVIQHGSGVPIIGYAQIYRRTGNRWTWIAKARVPRSQFRTSWRWTARSSLSPTSPTRRRCCTIRRRGEELFPRITRITAD